MIPKFNNDDEAEKFFSENEENAKPGTISSEDDRDITLIELEGEQYEVIDSVVYDGKMYVAILPYSEDEPDDDETAEFTLLEVIDDPDDADNCTLKTVDDDDLYTKIGDEFLKRFDSYEEE